MTMPIDITEEDPEALDDIGADDPEERYVALVRIVGSEVESVAPAFGSCMTWPIAQLGQGQPTQILTRRNKRHKAKITITSLGGATAVIFNSDPNHVASAQGATYVVVGNIPDWESLQPLYAIGIGGTPSITVIDESYGEIA